jgi:hypothetical protein
MAGSANKVMVWKPSAGGAILKPWGKWIRRMVIADCQSEADSRPPKRLHAQAATGERKRKS